MQIPFIHLFVYSFISIFLLKIRRCERLCEINEKNTSYNQCLVSATNELSSNLNNKFCFNLVQNIYGSAKVSPSKCGF